VKSIDSTCFICAIPKNRFDAEAMGFKSHCSDEHHMWNYMKFLINIYEKSEVNYKLLL